ncbi:signal recognition particle, SRP9/SRP14 subunit [Lipomyces oligophaga]|uniref:signal recognition particle, SRP9/SRP14 subunit n=1 Tax=Lipomyces oligophaga TaxID=45792 RepID=UPI0034CF4B6F
MASNSRLSNEQFLNELKQLFESNETCGRVFLQQKRLTPFDPVERKHNPSATDLSEIDNPDTSPHALLFRATNGNSNKEKKVKFTTVVEPVALDKFFKDYSDVVRAGATGLKKKDKKKTKGKKKKGKVAK